MTKGKVLFVSKYGSTKRYAKMIGKATGFKVEELGKKSSVDGVEVVVVGGWVMAGKMKGAKWIKKNWDVLKGKKLVIFAVGGTEPEKPEVNDFIPRSLNGLNLKKVGTFYLPGAIQPDKWGGFHKIIMKNVAKMEEDPEEKRKLSEGVSYVSKKNIEPLLEFIEK